MNKELSNVIIRLKLKHMRQKLGLSHRFVGLRLGCNRIAVSNWENDVRATIPFYRLIEITILYGYFSIDRFMMDDKNVKCILTTYNNNGIQKGEIMLGIGTRIKEVRNRLSLSQKQLGNKIEESETSVARWELEQRYPNLYQLYNLMTGAAKSSYIDSFLKRNSQAYELSQYLTNKIQNEQNDWLLI